MGARVVESGPGGADLAAGAWQRLEVLPDPRSPQGRIYPLACQVLGPPGPGEFVYVGGDAVDDRGHPCEVDGRDGPARPVGGRAQVDR